MAGKISKYAEMIKNNVPVWDRCKCGDPYLLLDGRPKCWACHYGPNARYASEKTYMKVRGLVKKYGNN